MYKLFLIIITLASFAMGQSDSLKFQASQAGSSAVQTGKLAITTITTASKEAYNSEACQKGIETSKVLISKSWKFLKSINVSIDSTTEK